MRDLTPEEIDRIADIYASVGARIPMCPHQWREYMTSKTIGKVSKSALAKGKIAPADSTPAPLRKGKHAKAARVEKGLKANREKARKA